MTQESRDSSDSMESQRHAALKTAKSILLRERREDQELLDHNAFLDQQVAERTRDLQIEIEERKRLEAHRASECSLLEFLGQGEALPDFLNRLALEYESRFPGTLCSVLLLDEEGKHLTHGAAPNLPVSYCQAIDGVEIGPSVGSCGTAAYFGTNKIVSNIATDPSWKGFEKLALDHGLASCWSVPILSTRGKVLGTFAHYFKAPKSPEVEELAAIERGAYLAGLAIERSRGEVALLKLNAELEQRVANRTLQLASRNEELKAFSYTVSHDLKAPLRGIAGYADELHRKHRAGMSERAEFCIDQIVAAAGNMSCLIEDLLHYCRVDAELPSLTHVNLRDLIEAIMRDRSLAISELGAEVTLHTPSAPLLVWQRGLSQVLTNLFDNALKYSRHATPPLIHIRAETVDKSMRISVEDNGVGFNMKYHDRIYGLFNRLVRIDEFEGTGAGLAIAKKLMDKQNGRIWAHSIPGKGTTFFIDLPVISEPGDTP